MASTRNKNTPGNYGSQQTQYRLYRDHLMYQHGAFGTAYHTNLPGLGLNPAQIPIKKLSYNYTDIETFLLGINSTNLVNPAPPLHPEFKCLKSVNLIEEKPVLMPEPFTLTPKQRPML